MDYFSTKQKFKKEKLPIELGVFLYITKLNNLTI